MPKQELNEQGKAKLSRRQQEMMNWIDAGKLLIVEGNQVATMGTLIKVGAKNTLDSLEQLGLVEKVVKTNPVSFTYYQKPAEQQE